MLQLVQQWLRMTNGIFPSPVTSRTPQMLRRNIALVDDHDKAKNVHGVATTLLARDL